MSASGVAADPSGGPRLRVAIQKSGRLGTAARELLAQCGLRWRESKDHLFCQGENLPVDLLLVRDDDIPGLVAEGLCDLGIVGQNVLDETAATLDLEIGRAWRRLGFGQCRLMLAVPKEVSWQGASSLQGLRIATSHPGILGKWLRGQGIQARVLSLAGSVEIAPRMGLADMVCDLVSSGATLEANQLRPVQEILNSEAVLVGPLDCFPEPKQAIADVLLQRIDATLQARDQRLVQFRILPQHLDAALAALHASRAPTVRPVTGSEEMSVQALTASRMDWPALDQLKAQGANTIIVMPVERILL